MKNREARRLVLEPPRFALARGQEGVIRTRQPVAAFEP
jgi:hypothetical protein